MDHPSGELRARNADRDMSPRCADVATKGGLYPQTEGTARHKSHCGRDADMRAIVERSGCFWIGASRETDRAAL